ncbi:MAG: hypothetical protein WCA32_03955 [Chromatiaceae bacterium]
MSPRMQRSAQHGRKDGDRLLPTLRSLIGRDCEYLGRPCRLVEILVDEWALVLETRELIPPIQPDQYGQALYRANDVLQVPIFDETGEALSEELKDLLVSLDPADTALPETLS